MARGRYKFSKSLRRFEEKKENRRYIIPGVLGISIGGRRYVEVPNRPGYVYVRLRQSQNELIQAFNNAVSPYYGLPVLVERKNVGGARYVVVGRDLGVYGDWGTNPFLPAHGGEHSFGNYYPGQDPVFVHGRQIMPLAVYPDGTGSGVHVYHYLSYSNEWQLVGGVHTGSLLDYRPTESGQAVFLLVWMDTDGSINVSSGSYFSDSLAKVEAEIYPYLPSLTKVGAIPLAAIRLGYDTNSIEWENIFDLRQWIFPTQSRVVRSLNSWTATSNYFIVGNGGDVSFLSADEVAYLISPYISIPSGSSSAGVLVHRVDGYLGPAEDVFGFVSPSTSVLSAVFIRGVYLGTSGSTIVDVNKNGYSIFAEESYRPTLSYDSSTGYASGVLGPVNLGLGDIITVDIDEAASNSRDLDIVLVYGIIGGEVSFDTDVLKVQVFS